MGTFPRYFAGAAPFAFFTGRTAVSRKRLAHDEVRSPRDIGLASGHVFPGRVVEALEVGRDELLIGGGEARVGPRSGAGFGDDDHQARVARTDVEDLADRVAGFVGWLSVHVGDGRRLFGGAEHVEEEFPVPAGAQVVVA